MTIKNLNTASDKNIEADLGARMKALRLRQNYTQQHLASASAVSLNTLKALEAGKGKISTLIAVLRELGALEQLDNFIPQATISPLQLARQHGKKRQRASGKRKQDDQTNSQW